MTCWRRLRDWQAAGVWRPAPPRAARPAGPGRRIDCGRCSLDSASFPAKRGASATGPNPTDRGKPGTKRHLVVDASGIPLAVALTPPNVHDSRMLRARARRGAADPAVRRAGPRAARPSCTPTKPTTSPLPPGLRRRGSRPGSPGAASRAPSGWAGTAGWSSARWPGSPASAGYRPLRAPRRHPARLPSARRRPDLLGFVRRWFC